MRRFLDGGDTSAGAVTSTPKIRSPSSNLALASAAWVQRLEDVAVCAVAGDPTDVDKIGSKCLRSSCIGGDATDAAQSVARKSLAPI